MQLIFDGGPDNDRGAVLHGQVTNAIGGENVNKGIFVRKNFCQQILKEDHQQIAVSQQLQGPVKIMSDGRCIHRLGVGCVDPDCR